MPEGTVVNYNAQLISNPHEIELLQGRAFRFGDGVFETILIRKGRPHFLDDHLERLIDGMEILQFQFDVAFWLGKLKAAIKKTLLEAKVKNFGKLRIVVFRGGSGAYLPESNDPNFLIEVSGFSSDPWTLKNFNKIGIYHHIPITPSPLTRIKSNNSLPYIMAAKYARSNKWNDALLRSSDGYIIEGSMANLFIVHAATVFTPPVFGGCLPGIMRRQIIRILREKQIHIVEKHLTILDLNLADEIFLCNSIRGIIPVKKVEGSSFKPFEDQMAPYIMDWIREFKPPRAIDPTNN